MMLDAEALAPVIKAAMKETLESPEIADVWARAVVDMGHGATLTAGASPLAQQLINRVLADPMIAGLPKAMAISLLENDDFVRLVAERVSAAMRASLT